MSDAPMTAPEPATALDLDAIEARANAATSGPWEVEAAAVVCDRYEDERPGVCGPHDVDWPLLAEDAEFIAHARTDVPALVAEVRRLRAALAAPRPVLATGELTPWGGQMQHLRIHGQSVYLPPTTGLAPGERERVHIVRADGGEATG